jgi:hypothetical protein
MPYVLQYTFLLLDGTRTLVIHLSMSIVLNYGMSIIKSTFMTFVIISLLPLHTISFGYTPYKISQEALATLKNIADWYMGKYYTYIRVYGNYEAPHLLPKYVLDRLLIWEIPYQTIETGITSFLSSNSKKLWPTFPINIGGYTLLNGPHARK